MFGFEKLDTWQQAIEYANLVYRVTATFPSDERFGLTSQMRRSAVSISANVAEGSSRSSGKDFAHFVEIGYGSLMENVSEAFVSRNQRFRRPEQFTQLYGNAEQLARMLSGLRTSLHPRD